MFCAEHRLPENHSCPELWKARAPKKVSAPDLKVETPWMRRDEGYRIFRVKPTRNLTELKHLLISVILVTGVGMSLVYRSLFILGAFMLLILGLAFALSFLAHELSHKILAQRNGLWAEFRLVPMGALLTLISIISPIKFISPGAVLIAGFIDYRVGGRISLAGPLTNLVIAAFLSLPAYFMQWYFPLWVLAIFNAYIALFNLIPFGSLDGLKVFIWSKVIWAISFTASIGLTALLYLRPI